MKLHFCCNPFFGTGCGVERARSFVCLCLDYVRVSLFLWGWHVRDKSRISISRSLTGTKKITLISKIRYGYGYGYGSGCNSRILHFGGFGQSKIRASPVTGSFINISLIFCLALSCWLLVEHRIVRVWLLYLRSFMGMISHLTHFQSPYKATLD